MLRDVRHAARRDAMETVDDSEYDKQIRRLIDRHVTGTTGARTGRGAYDVQKVPRAEPTSRTLRSEQKISSAEADLIRTRLRRTIAHDLADDPYAQKVFSASLKCAIDEAEALFDRPGKQYAQLRDFERRVDLRITLDMPGSVGGQSAGQAYFGAILMSAGRRSRRQTRRGGAPRTCRQRACHQPRRARCSRRALARSARHRGCHPEGLTDALLRFAGVGQSRIR